MHEIDQLLFDSVPFPVFEMPRHNPKKLRKGDISFLTHANIEEIWPDSMKSMIGDRKLRWNNLERITNLLFIKPDASH
jgi:hypothetical protein